MNLEAAEEESKEKKERGVWEETPVLPFSGVEPALPSVVQAWGREDPAYVTAD